MSRSFRYILASLVVFILLIGAFSGGLIIGWIIPSRPLTSLFSENPSRAPTPQVGSESRRIEKQGGDLFSAFWEAWDLVHSEFVDQPVDDVQLMRGAIRGMIDALGDEHSSYMDPVEYQQMTEAMQGEYGGIGAWVDTTGDYLVITSPMPDTPAAKAGLKPGDKVIKVDGEDMTGIDGSLVLQRVKGEPGTTVVLTILREGEEPFDVTITRALITVPSVTSKMLDNNIAYIQLMNYGDNSTEEVRKALKTLLAQKPKGLILDLRFNGGGYVNTAIEITSQFIGKGPIMYEEYGDGTRTTFEAKPGGLALDIPLVVLVNEGTASAAEITAGAIQDTGRGVLVGVTTFGKGSVQIWTPLKDNQGAVRITTARWITPNGRQIHGQGLEPDYIVELTGDEPEGQDPQLDKAIEILSK